MNRVAWLALGGAFAAHAVGLFLVPLPRVPSPPPAQETQPAPAIPVALEFLAAEAVVPAPVPPRVHTESGTRAVRSKVSPAPSQKREHSTDERAPAKIGDSADRPMPPPDKDSPLRMRGRGPAVAIDPLRGSRLQAAIARAAGEVPGDQGRSDLLGGTPERSAPPSPWRDSGGGTKVAEGEPFKAKIDRDGTIHFQDRPNVQLDGIKTSPDTFLPVLAGHFDVTDAVMASFGEVIYPYRKLKLMDQSREMRAGMALRSNQEALQDSLADYPRKLRSLWRSPDYTLAQRKEVLFALWDECAESGSDSVLATSVAIRATTLAFIRKVLPPTAAGAFTDDELKELNARRQSAERFRPYAD